MSPERTGSVDDDFGLFHNRLYFVAIRDIRIKYLNTIVELQVLLQRSNLLF